MEQIKAETKVKRDETVIFHDMDGETLMLSFASGEYLSLPPIGTRIWQILENPASAADISEALVEIYNVSPEQCLADVLVFMNQLVEKGVVMTVDE